MVIMMSMTVVVKNRGGEEKGEEEPQGFEDLCCLIEDSQERIRRESFGRKSEQSVLTRIL